MEKQLHIRVRGPEGYSWVVSASSYKELEEQSRRKFSLPLDAQIQLRDKENTILDDDAFWLLTEGSSVDMFLDSNVPEKQEKTNLIATVTDSFGNLNCQVGDNNIMVNINIHGQYTKFVQKRIPVESLLPNETLISMEHSRISPDSKGFIAEFGIIVNECLGKIEIERDILLALQADNCKLVRQLIFHLQLRYDAYVTKIKKGSFTLELFFFDDRKRFEIKTRIPDLENYLKATLVPESVSLINPSSFALLSIRPIEVKSRAATTNDVWQFSLWKVPSKSTRTNVGRLPMNVTSFETEPWSGCLQRITTDLCRAGMANTEDIMRVISDCIKSLSDSRDEDVPVLNTLLVIEISGSMTHENFNAGIANCKQFLYEIEQNSKQGLDEKIGILTFGNKIQTLSRFSFDFNYQLALLENISQETDGKTNLIESLLCSFLAINYFDSEKNPSIPKTNGRIAFISEGKLFWARDKQILTTLGEALAKEHLFVPLHFHHLQQSEEQEIRNLVDQSKGLLIPRHGGRILGKFNRFMRKPEIKLDALDNEDIQFVRGETNTLTDTEQKKKTM